MDIDLTGIFSTGDNSWKVKGFYDGEGKYKIRFLPQMPGMYTWRITGAVEASGEEMCEKNAGRHGMVKASGTSFIYQDGSAYHPFGTTIYALAHQTEGLIRQTMDTLKKAPFNKVRHCVFPKDYAYNHNEPTYYPFEKDSDGKWDVHHPCFAYWNHLEKLIMQLGEIGIESDLILFHSYDRWGFSKMSMDENRTYLEYLLRRLSAIPCIWWSIANEYDLLFNRKMEDWYEFEKIICENDVYGHLLSNHNCTKLYDFSRPAITHCSIQTIAMHRAGMWQQEFKKPVVYDECCYEGDIQYEWGNISGFELVNRFWQACTEGAYVSHGETFYSEDEILWWAKGGVLKGESPSRIGFLKEIIYGLPGHLEPWKEDASVDAEDDNPIDVNEFVHLLETLPEVERENGEWKAHAFCGHCGNRFI
ncbi:MAG: DUF5060 domain-containing protein [Eubacteriales bacterium]|nr:DUF5060 domain-containing protein [Eubacteriales bacterium]